MLPPVGAALGWGALAASSLVIGAMLGLLRPWPKPLVGAVLAFGAGALISAVSFDLVEEGSRLGDPGYVGLGLAAHGTQKLFGWFGGHGLTGTGGFFESLGFRPGVLFALAAGLGELGGGLLTAAGFLGPVGPALITVVMLVAILTVHRANGFFASANGVEMPLMYLTAALPLAFTGAGAYSVDARLGFDALRGPTVAWIALAAAIVVALINVALRRPSAPARTAA